MLSISRIFHEKMRSFIPRFCNLDLSSFGFKIRALKRCAANTSRTAVKTTSVPLHLALIAFVCPFYLLRLSFIYIHREVQKLFIYAKQIAVTSLTPSQKYYYYKTTHLYMISYVIKHCIHVNIIVTLILTLLVP